MAKYKAYPEYKDSGVEWLGNVPTKWLITELKRYSWVKGGYAFASDLFISFGEPVIRIGDISQDGSINLANCKYVSRTIAKQSQSYIVQNGELLMAMTGATIGKAGFYENKSPALINQRVGLFKTLDKLMNYRFLWYTLKSSGYQEYIKLTAFGGAQPNISDAGMVGYRTTIPSLQEQVFIASFLDNETAKIDSLIEKQQQIIELLKEKRQAVISHAVTKGLNPDVPMKDSGVEWLGKVPNHWGVTSIKYLSEVKRGASPRPIDDPKYFDDDGEYAWTRIADVSKAGMYLTETTQRLSCLGSSLSVKLQANELFISIAGTVGKPCLTISKACIHDGFVYFPSLKLNNKFLFFIFDAGQAFQGLGKMGTQLNLNTETIGDIKIGIPSASEISNIILHIEQQKNNYDKLIIAVHQAMTLLKERRTALISAAVTGKIDVRNWRVPNEQTAGEAEAVV